MTFQEGSLESLERINSLDRYIKDYLREKDLSYLEANTALIMMLIDLNIHVGWDEEEFMQKVRLTWKLIQAERKKQGNY